MASCKVSGKDSHLAMLTAEWCQFGRVLAGRAAAFPDTVVAASPMHTVNFQHWDLFYFLMQAGADFLSPPAPCLPTVIKGDRVNSPPYYVSNAGTCTGMLLMMAFH